MLWFEIWMKCKNSLIREKFMTRLWDWAIFSSSPSSFFPNAILLLAILMCYLIAFEWMVAYFFLLENVLWFPHCDLFKPWFRNMYVQFLYAFCVSYIIMGKSWGCWEDSWFRMSCSTLAIYFSLTTEMCCTKITEDLFFYWTYNGL